MSIGINFSLLSYNRTCCDHPGSRTLIHSPAATPVSPVSTCPRVTMRVTAYACARTPYPQLLLPVDHAAAGPARPKRMRRVPLKKRSQANRCVERLRPRRRRPRQPHTKIARPRWPNHQRRFWVGICTEHQQMRGCYSEKRNKQRSMLDAATRDVHTSPYANLVCSYWLSNCLQVQIGTSAAECPDTQSYQGGASPHIPRAHVLRAGY